MGLGFGVFGEGLLAFGGSGAGLLGLLGVWGNFGGLWFGVRFF